MVEGQSEGSVVGVGVASARRGGHARKRAGRSARERLRVEVRGAVQGVGFRPFVYRLATRLSLTGWVVNDARGVTIEVEGTRPALERFLAGLSAERPAHARIHERSHEWLAPSGFKGFEIRHGGAAGDRTAVPLPELATCEECLAEVLDPGDRRYRYPFANCTRCGPRFTILRELPYDRPNTTMRAFELCPECRAEYQSPADRRFEAQPIACPACGPRIALHDPAGVGAEGGGAAVPAMGEEAMARLADALRAGRIAAVKGLGGFHLMCDAGNEAAVARLRARKPRTDKPFALMVAGLDQARALCELSDEAAGILASPEAPILLLPRRPDAPVAPNVAPGHPSLGIMLAYTPLHHLLLRELNRPIVATSGNLTDEPIAIDDREAIERLGAVADVFLLHDRPIERHMDDSVGWMMDGGFALLRRARGFAPLPVRVGRRWPTVLAVGAHLKSTIALALGRDVFLSQHIGDLETPEAIVTFERVIADALRLHAARPAAIAHDLHPDYASTRWARRAAADGLAPRLIGVQHHHAHLAACLAEHDLEGRALGVTWDGTGYGPDGTVWGGEFLLGDAAGFERVAHLRPFRLPGGEAAVREPRRVALALAWELEGERALRRTDLSVVTSFSPTERAVLAHMLARGLNAPRTSSAGRLFDGVAAVVGFAPIVTFEGQAAAALEFAADPEERGAYPFEIVDAPGTPAVVDWRLAVAMLLADLAGGTPRGVIAARFHNGLASAIAAVARGVGERRVALTGGCFQNRLLVERATERLRAAGHQVLVHRQVPPNDGGVSLGQAHVAAARLMSG